MRAPSTWKICSRYLVSWNCLVAVHRSTARQASLGDNVPGLAALRSILRSVLDHIISVVYGFSDYKGSSRDIDHRVLMEHNKNKGNLTGVTTNKSKSPPKLVCARSNYQQCPHWTARPGRQDELQLMQLVSKYRPVV